MTVRRLIRVALRAVRYGCGPRSCVVRSTLSTALYTLQSNRWNFSEGSDARYCDSIGIARLVHIALLRICSLSLTCHLSYDSGRRSQLGDADRTNCHQGSPMVQMTKGWASKADHFFAEKGVLAVFCERVSSEQRSPHARARARALGCMATSIILRERIAAHFSNGNLHTRQRPDPSAGPRPSLSGSRSSAGGNMKNGGRPQTVGIPRYTLASLGELGQLGHAARARAQGRARPAHPATCSTPRCAKIWEFVSAFPRRRSCTSRDTAVRPLRAGPAQNASCRSAAAFSANPMSNRQRAEEQQVHKVQHRAQALARR